MAQDFYYKESDFQIVDRTVELAERHGATPAQIALAWMLNKPGIVAPIIGASKMPHLEQAVAALEIELSQDEIEYLEEPYQPRQVLGHH